MWMWMFCVCLSQCCCCDAVGTVVFTGGYISSSSHGSRDISRPRTDSIYFTERSTTLMPVLSLIFWRTCRCIYFFALLFQKNIMVVALLFFLCRQRYAYTRIFSNTSTNETSFAIHFVFHIFISISYVYACSIIWCACSLLDYNSQKIHELDSVWWGHSRRAGHHSLDVSTKHTRSHTLTATEATTRRRELSA